MKRSTINCSGTCPKAVHSDVKIENHDMNVKWNEFYPWKTFKGFSFIINEYWMLHVLIFIDCTPPPFYWISSIVPLPHFIDFRQFHPSPFYWFLSSIFIDFRWLYPSPILLNFVDCTSPPYSIVLHMPLCSSYFL